MGASAAMVRDVFSSRDNRQLAGSSIAFYRKLMEEHPELRAPAPLLDLHGYLWLLPQRLLDEYRPLLLGGPEGIEVEMLDARALETLPGLVRAPARWYEGDTGAPPEPIVAGLFGRNCGAVDPAMLARYYQEEASRRGVEFLFNTCVQRLSFEGREEILLHEPSGRPFFFQEHIPGRLRISRVHFGSGRYVDTDQVVVAGGAWAGRLLEPLGVATACSPRPQMLCSISGPEVEELLRWEPPVVTRDRPEGRTRFPFLILPTGATLKPLFRERQIWIGLVDTVAHPIGTREDPSQEGKLPFRMGELGEREAFATDLLPAVSPYLPRLESPRVRLENSWGGYYNFSPEGAPVLTREPFGVIFVGGDSGSGIMKADALGRLVAAACQEKREASLGSGEVYPLDRLSLTRRSVEEERIIL